MPIYQPTQETRDDNPNHILAIMPDGPGIHDQGQDNPDLTLYDGKITESYQNKFERDHGLIKDQSGAGLFITESEFVGGAENMNQGAGPQTGLPVAPDSSVP